MLSQDERWLLKEKYGGEKSVAFFADCNRLAAGEPLAYIIGFVPFLGCKIWLDSHPLIPRPETEYWVEQFIQSYQSPNPLHSNHSLLGRPSQTHPAIVARPLSEDGSAEQSLVQRPQRQYSERGQAEPMTAPPNPKILDLCAGSGALGVAIANALPYTHLTFGELEERHRTTIFKNLAEHHIDCTRYQVFTSNLFENISGKFDYIVSNPPYIDPALDRTEASVKNHEPHEALYGGRGGLELIARIIAAAPAHLTPRGQLWLEHEPEQSASIQALAVEHDLSATTHTDQYEVERYSVLVLQ